jgi:hypothetical protein
MLSYNMLNNAAFMHCRWYLSKYEIRTAYVDIFRWSVHDESSLTMYG